MSASTSFVTRFYKSQTFSNFGTGYIIISGFLDENIPCVEAFLFFQHSTDSDRNSSFATRYRPQIEIPVGDPGRDHTLYLMLNRALTEQKANFFHEVCKPQLDQELPKTLHLSDIQFSPQNSEVLYEIGGMFKAQFMGYGMHARSADIRQHFQIANSFDAFGRLKIDTEEIPYQ